MCRRRVSHQRRRMRASATAVLAISTGSVPPLGHKCARDGR